MSSSKNGNHGIRNIVIVFIAVLVIIVILLIPVIPFDYKVETTTVTTQTDTIPTSTIQTVLISTETTITNTIPTSQIVTVTVPVQTAQSRSQTLLNLGSYTLQANYYYSSYGQVPAGSDIAITWSASNTVNVYAFTSDQYSVYTKNSGNANPIVSQKNVASGTLGFHASASDTYYIVIFNPHSTLFGLIKEDVGIYSANAVATWQETVTTTTTQVQTIATSTTTIQTIPTSTTTIKTVTNIQPVPKRTMISLLDWLLGIHP